MYVYTLVCMYLFPLNLINNYKNNNYHSNFFSLSFFYQIKLIKNIFGTILVKKNLCVAFLLILL